MDAMRRNPLASRPLMAASSARKPARRVGPGVFRYSSLMQYTCPLRTARSDSHPRQDWLLKALEKRLREELARLKVEINEEKSRMVNLSKGESFSFLGFEYRRLRSRNGRWWPQYVPRDRVAESFRE